MEITYKDIHDFNEKDLEDLFLSVEWSSGHFPDKLVIAMKNFETVFSAWDGDKLVGLVSAMDDGIMTAYVHYVLIRPDKRVTDKYDDYLRIVVVSYDDEIEFYEHCGFEKADDASPMFITDLWT